MWTISDIDIFHNYCKVNINLTIHAMVNYTALNETDDGGGVSECNNTSNNGDEETNEVIISLSKGHIGLYFNSTSS